MRLTSLILLPALTLSIHSEAQHLPEFSTAGFFEIERSGRTAHSMNPAWKFHKGSLPDAHIYNFDDSNWQVVSLPNGIEYLPTEASGCINYQGEIWYRKQFTPESTLKGKKIFLHFEAIMGKSRVFVNGKLLKEHFGGYLPVVVEISDAIDWNKENVIAVWADNSDDPDYAPGKPQDVLDFSYFGGIYRDCWLVTHNQVYITDPNFENEKAGGGVFIAYDRVSEKSADILLKTHLRNTSKKSFKGSIVYELRTTEEKPVASFKEAVHIAPGRCTVKNSKSTVLNPKLWSPDSPELYNLYIRVMDENENIIDGYRKRIGIRSIEFKGEDGFWLNGKPYEKPLIGANRHQDFAIVGNAVSNNIHWRDAKKLRDAGLKVVRNAHCPQDPAFMDACDELGLFVIVNTPGWQFWNEKPIFEQHVYQDIRNMVRRDRNHPSVWMWEPILNETWYPADFAKNARNIVDEEYPFPYCYSGCDSEARGHEHFPILFSHPTNADRAFALKQADKKKTYFTREWGDNVDDWSSHNSPSRVSRNWGEQPMLVQARHYANPPYPYTSYNALYETNRQHVGGCLWHSFDHQRGYHPDPFYGGLMDVFRQPKYAYHLFQAQRDPLKTDLIAETGPMVFIAHEMTPFSNPDVEVYSNCEQIRLSVNKDGYNHIYTKPVKKSGIPSPIITFENVFDFMIDKKLSYAGRQNEVFMLAEGLIDGEVVATHRISPARRPEKVILWVDNENTDLIADGSDFVTIVAAITDKNENIKRLNNYFIRFEIEGEGKIIGDSSVFANPAPVRWGTAPVLIQSTTNPGQIKITAMVVFEGSQMPVSAELILQSKPAPQKLIYKKEDLDKIKKNTTSNANRILSDDKREIERLRQELNNYKLKEVERQQTEFGEAK
ncbi:MAG: glycoside hydrolase family 2 TIM barrel-domain containing protein [Bacteroidales bacterium]